MKMRPILDKQRFGPWALVTGSSSGIGKAIARHLGASGINVVLVARREAELERVGAELRRDFSVDYRVVKADLTTPSFFDDVERATRELDIGLVVGNAGFASPGEFLTLEREELLRAVRLKVDANLTLVHHFGRRLAARRRGGILLISSIGGLAGVPYVAHTAGVEAYVLNLGEGLHVELEPRGVHVTVLMPGPTLTESMAKMGVDPSEMPLKPMSAERCAAEGLTALARNRATHVAGRMNRIMARLMPRSVATSMMGAMIGKKFARESLAASHAAPRALSGK
jgi:short-subunit dehydrogenase